MHACLNEMADEIALSLEENTYQLEPAEDEVFRPSKVEAIINEVLRDILEGKNFTPEHGKQWSNDIVAEIRQRCKILNLPRYKIVVQAMVSKNNGQGVRVSSKCLWDTATDNWASGSFHNNELFAVAMVFGCYYE